MNILFIGDVCGRCGREALFEYLEDVKYEYNIDFTIANGENAAGGLGISVRTYDEMVKAGVDFFTLGNHAFSKSNEARILFERKEALVRPANMLPEDLPGEGMEIVRCPNGEKIAIINLLGKVYMENATDPFLCVKTLVEKARKVTNIIIVDFHAEATSEKEAMGFYLDGKVSAVFGTHTHIQTADEKILPNGSAYITDVGMTGAVNSVLGMDVETAVGRFVTPEERHPFKSAEGKARFCAVVVEIDEKTGKAIGVKRIWKS
ncbi:MAG: TIGR00282 family metallophosphoesterase [Clostridia bacterium]|nr:TIGR00282 family metallophosphoesterase [Clostridia bacterium]